MNRETFTRDLIFLPDVWSLENFRTSKKNDDLTTHEIGLVEAENPHRQQRQGGH